MLTHRAIILNWQTSILLSQQLPHSSTDEIVRVMHLSQRLRILRSPPAYITQDRFYSRYRAIELL